MLRLACVSFVVMLLLVQSAAAEPIVRAWMQAYDDANQPINIVYVGQTFQLRVLVEDLRDPHAGVASAYFASAFNPNLLTLTAEPQVDSYFTDFMPLSVVSGNVFAGGGLSTQVDPGQLPDPGPQLLYTVEMRGKKVGKAAFDLAGPLNGDDLEWFVYFQDSEVPVSQIETTRLVLSVIPEPSSIVLAGLASAAIGLVAFGRRRRDR